MEHLQKLERDKKLRDIFLGSEVHQGLSLRQFLHMTKTLVILFMVKKKMVAM